VIGQRVAGERWMAHETQQMVVRGPLRSASNEARFSMGGEPG
jgi:hypothetical protein